MIALGQQGNRTQWDGILKRKVCWSDICGSNFVLIQAVYDTIPRPTNLKTWGKAETPQYPLCEKRWLLKNILSCCTRALGDGHYIWHHNQVLRVIAKVFNKCLRTSTYKTVCKRISFLKAVGNIRSAPSEKKHWDLAQPQIGSYLLIWISCWNSLIILFEHNFSQTWFLFQYNEVSDHVGVDSIMGGKDGWVPWKKAHQISGTFWAV